MLDRLDLNSLRLYYEVVTAGSITRAAEELKLPKSTISRKLAQLERQLGAILLKKGPRRLSTTHIGAALYERCRRLTAEIEDIGQAAAEMQGELRGVLRVSIPIDFGLTWISRAIAPFLLKYPDVELQIEVNSGEVNPREDPYDVTIQFGMLKPSGLTLKRFATMSRGIYASPAYLARRGTPKAVEDCSAHDCIITAQQRHDGLWRFLGGNKNRFVKISGKVTVNNIGVVRELCIGGVGLGMLPNVMCENDVKAGRLVRVLTDWKNPPIEATALILSRRDIPIKTRVFLDFLTERMAAVAGEGRL